MPWIPYSKLIFNSLDPFQAFSVKILCLQRSWEDKRNCTNCRNRASQGQRYKPYHWLGFCKIPRDIFSVELINAILMCNILCLITLALLLKGGKAFTVQHFTVSFGKGSRYIACIIFSADSWDSRMATCQDGVQPLVWNKVLGQRGQNVVAKRRNAKKNKKKAKQHNLARVANKN